MTTLPAKGLTLDLQALRGLFTDPLSRIAPDCDAPRLEYLCKPKPVADDSTKLLARDSSGRPIAVALVSSAVDPMLIRRATDHAQSIKQRLGPTLGCVILDPLETGTVNDTSYAIFPYCKPMSLGRIMRHVDHARLARPVFRWLHRVTRETAFAPDSNAIENRFRRPLGSMAQMSALPATVREAATRTLQRLDSGDFAPKHCVMHNDLWHGNILFANHALRAQPGPRSPFVVIDWPGGAIDGFPIYDLLRLGRSFYLPRPLMRHQLRLHTQALGSPTADAEAHLLTAMANLAANLGHFAPEHFARVASECLQTVRRLTGSPAGR